MSDVDKIERDTLLPAYFGEFGGQYVPEPLYPVLDQLERAFVAVSYTHLTLPTKA